MVVSCRAITEDSVRQELFEEYVILLQQKAKEKEKKREEEKVSSYSFLVFKLFNTDVLS